MMYGPIIQRKVPFENGPEDLITLVGAFGPITYRRKNARWVLFGMCVVMVPFLSLGAWMAVELVMVSL